MVPWVVSAETEPLVEEEAAAAARLFLEMGKVAHAGGEEVEEHVDGAEPEGVGVAHDHEIFEVEVMSTAHPRPLTRLSD